MENVCKERQAALNLTMDRLLSDAKEDMELALEHGDMRAAVKFANWLNTLEEITSMYTDMYVDEPDLMDA